MEIDLDPFVRHLDSVLQTADAQILRPSRYTPFVSWGYDLELLGNGRELFESRVQILGDFQCEYSGGRQVGAVFERFVFESEDNGCRV